MTYLRAKRSARGQRRTSAAQEKSRGGFLCSSEPTRTARGVALEATAGVPLPKAISWLKHDVGKNYTRLPANRLRPRTLGGFTQERTT